MAEENSSAHDPHELALLRAEYEAIAETGSIDEIKSLRDRAEAMRKYVQSAALGLELQNQTAELKLRAERKVGELLTKLHLRGGDQRSKSKQTQMTLRKLGITHNQSHRWQLEASVSSSEFESYVHRANKMHQELTAAGLLRLARDNKSTLHGIGLRPIVRRILNRLHRIDQHLHELAQRRQVFRCILVDPPWTPLDGNRISAGGERETIVQRLSNLPIRQVTGKQAHIHIWCPGRDLLSGRQLLKSWGFNYRSCFVWLKAPDGFGPYWHESHEFLLLGIRGEMPFRDGTLPGWLQTETHAGEPKPKIIHELIARASPGPYLEIFGTTAVPGWTLLSTEKTVEHKTKTARKNATRLAATRSSGARSSVR